jgi:hypothetical protein
LSIAFSLLLISIGIVPVLAIFDGFVARSLVSALAAAALAFVGISARTADVHLAAQVTRPLKLAAAVPAIWMIIQILPTPFSGMSHSIWINANEALNQQSWGHISVDIGKTIEALTFYLANISLIVVGIFVTKDRRRAELTLWALTAITTLTTIALLVSKLIGGMVSINETISAISSLGIILSLTTGVRAIERYESRPAETAGPAQDTRIALAVCGTGLLVCIAGLAASGTLNVGLIVAFGTIAFGSVQAIRRVGLASWAIAIFITTIVTAAAMIVLWRYDPGRTLSPFLQFAIAAAPDAISVAQRMLLDTGWLGTGGATYAPLLPIYQELGSSVTTPPSTASAFAIELGWPMALFTIALAVGLIGKLYRGALVRGRDSFYPAAATGCAIIILGQAFCDASLLHSSVAVVGDAVIGLGLAQSVSRGNSP